MVLQFNNYSYINKYLVIHLRVKDTLYMSKANVHSFDNLATIGQSKIFEIWNPTVYKT